MGNLTAHFSRHEFECKKDGLPCPHCGGTLPDEATLHNLAYKLEQLRQLLGNKPISINSAYRCKERNAELPDASPSSQHLLGNAVDISIAGGREAVITAAIQAARCGFTGIGVDVRNYRYIHVDMRYKKLYEPLSIWFYK